MPSPEKERSSASCSDLQLTPIHMRRDEEKLSEQEGASSPVHSAAPPTTPTAPPTTPPTLFKCDYYGHLGLCRKIFTCISDWRYHIHEVHDQCLDFYRPNPPVPCPWPGCK